MIKIIQGNLLRQKADMILNPINADIIFDKGIPYFIRRNGGEQIEKQCLKYYPAELGQTFVTDAGSLGFQKIVHLVNRKFGQKTSYSILFKSFSDALYLFLNTDFTTFAIPPIYNRFSPEITANIMSDCLKEVAEKKTEIKERKIFIVIYDKEAAQIFHSVFQLHLGSWVSPELEISG